nr:DUF262 domain-containing protein [uncultured Flavobacterium sp.]
MNTTNDKINIVSHNVKWAIDLMKDNHLTVDNSFQRKYVWLEKHQIKLIETILMGYPIPEIYIWQKDIDANTGNMKFSIIDGQQRLGAIQDFINGGFILNTNILEPYNKAKEFSGKKFEDLSPENKSLIWKFKLSIRIVDESISRNDVVTMFLRLNSTNMSLNPQELRNAEFDGLFITSAAEISENKFWTKHEIFSTLDKRRMLDIQFISSILLFIRQGISEDTTQENYNKAYDLYNEEYSEKEEDQKLVYKIISECEKIIDNQPNIEKFIRRKTHLYTLFLNIYYFIQIQDKVEIRQINNYKEFVEAYNNDAFLTTHFGSKGLVDEIYEYKTLSSTGTQSKSNRLRRFEILKKVLSS